MRAYFPTPILHRSERWQIPLNGTTKSTQPPRVLRCAHQYSTPSSAPGFPRQNVRRSNRPHERPIRLPPQPDACSRLAANCWLLLAGRTLRLGRITKLRQHGKQIHIPRNLTHSLQISPFGRANAGRAVINAVAASEMNNAALTFFDVNNFMIGRSILMNSSGGQDSQQPLPPLRAHRLNELRYRSLEEKNLQSALPMARFGVRSRHFSLKFVARETPLRLRASKKQP
jgi:hypothetical protein